MNAERISEIRTKEDLADFIGEFRKELVLNADCWENPDLGRFLAAMEAWIRSMDMYAKNSGDSDAASPGWSTFANILCASKVYE